MAALLDGCLHPILKALHADDTLMLGLRGDYVSVYYRGGELLKIRPGSSGDFRITANIDYGHPQDHLDRTVGTAAHADSVVATVPAMKWLMDCHSKIRSSHEREFQQLVVRENNRSRSAGSSDYFITDMEHASGKSRFDMLGARWGHRDRKHGDRLTPVIFEMKYGEQALTGGAGLEKHIKDLRGWLSELEFIAKLKANVGSQFNQLDELGLLDFNRSKSIKAGEFKCGHDRPQVVLVFAAVNPRSRRLLQALRKAREQWRSDPIPDADLLVFRAGFCGYLMNEDSMMGLDEMIAMLEGTHPDINLGEV